MSESTEKDHKDQSKSEKELHEGYERIVRDASALMDGERDYVANTANIAALGFEEWNRLCPGKVNWFGFYFLRSAEELVLGPFGGSPACIRINIQKGVCGKCVRDKTTIHVPGTLCFFLYHRYV